MCTCGSLLDNSYLESELLHGYNVIRAAVPTHLWQEHVKYTCVKADLDACSVHPLVAGACQVHLWKSRSGMRNTHARAVHMHKQRTCTRTTHMHVHNAEARRRRTPKTHVDTMQMHAQHADACPTHMHAQHA